MDHPSSWTARDECWEVTAGVANGSTAPAPGGDAPSAGLPSQREHVMKMIVMYACDMGSVWRFESTPCDVTESKPPFSKSALASRLRSTEQCAQVKIPSTSIERFLHTFSRFLSLSSFSQK